MKKWHIKSLLRCLLTGVVISTCLLLSSTLSLGEVSSAATSDCRLSPNPDDCYRQQNQQQWRNYDPTSLIPTTLNSKNLGLDGPLSAELKYDADLSWILGVNYIQMLGDSLGIATKLAGGPNEVRGNLTAGYALGQDHRLKVTYEYLTQNLGFDFASGAVDQWVAQHSLGAAYQYAIRHQIVHSLELSGVATRAGSKNLANLSFNQQTLADNSGYLYAVNYRHIAGGSENTLLGAVNLLPFANKDTTLTLGAGYSSITYNTIYETSSDYSANKGLAYKAELTHILSPKTKLTTGIDATAASTAHKIEFARILPHKLQASVKAQYTAGQAGMKNNSSVAFGISYPAPASYSSGGFNEVQELKSWIEKPVLYSPRVLAIKDEKIQQYAFKTGASIADQSLSFTQLLAEVPTGLYFDFNDPGVQVTFSVVTQKLASANLPGAVNAAPAAGDTKDYTSDLNLQLAVTAPNQAVLKSASAAGVPATNAAGQSNAGSYRVTLTATASSNGSNPLVVTSGFNLIVASNVPQWNSNQLPSASMGFTYPKPGEAEVNVSSKVTVTAPDASATITIEDAADCIHPSWLVLAACASDTSKQCLSSNSLVVPNTSDNASFCVRLKATGNSSGASALQSFTPSIIQAPPVWGNIPLVNLDITDFSTQTYLDSYVTNSTGLLIQPDSGFDSAHWTLAHDTAGYYVQQKDSGSPLPVGPVTLPVTASNSTSAGSVSKALAFYLSNSTYSAAWQSASLPNAPAGLDSYNDNLNTVSPALVKTTTSDGSDVANDSYDFTVVSATAGNWSISADSNGNLGQLTGSGLGGLAVGTQVKIVFTALSHAANKLAVGGNQSATEQQITITISANPDLNVNWVGSTIPDSPLAVDTYSQDLNSVVPALVQTSAGGTAVSGDKYDFTVANPSAGSWTISSDNSTLQGSGLGNLALGTVVQLTLTAHSHFADKDATGGNQTATQQRVSFTIGSNPNLNVTWVDNTLPDAEVGVANYSQNLNTLALALVQTTNGSAPVVGDQYDFSVVSANHGSWTVTASNGALGVLSGSGLDELKLGASIEIILTAHSHAANKLATGGNVPGQDTQQKITFTIVPNANLQVNWVSNTLPGALVGVDAYSSNLNSLSLVQTSLNGNPLVEKYDYSVVSASAGSWQVVDDGTGTNTTGVLQGSGLANVPLGTTVTLTLIAFSPDADKNATNMSGDGEQQIVTFIIGTNPDLAVNWVSTITSLPDAQVGAATYSQDLNSLLPSLVTTKNGSALVADKYDFAIVGTPASGSWAIVNDGSGTPGVLQGTNLASIAVGAAVNIVFTAHSHAANKLATGGNVSGQDTQQRFSITFSNPPVWANTSGSIKFDTTGDGGELGAVTDGISLNAMIANSGLFTSGLTFAWDTADTTAHSNWQIKKNISDGKYYLLRLRNTTTTPATVDATDVGSVAAIPSIKACDAASPTLCASSGAANPATATTIQATVNADANLVYQYATSPPAVIALIGATSDGNGNVNPSLGSTQSPALITPTAPVGIFTSTDMTGSTATKVVNDSAVTYVKRLGATSQGYLAYSNVDNVTSINFLAPTTTEYAALATSQNKGYLNAKSKANGNGAALPANGNVLNLPPLTASQLIIVPNFTANNSGYVANNGGTNVGVGTSPSPASNSVPCLSASHFAITSIVFTLPAVPGKTYKLNHLTQTGGSYPEAGICTGSYLPTSVTSVCGGGPSYNAENIIKQGNTSRCPGTAKYTPIPLSTINTSPVAFTGGVGQGGDFTVYVGSGDLNNGSKMPATYMPNMTTAPAADQKAPMAGSSFNAGANTGGNYSDFPRVILQ